MNVSKWLKIQALLEVDELKNLLVDVGFYNVSEVLDAPDLTLDRAEFFAQYEGYVAALKMGQIPRIDRKIFSAGLSKQPILVQQLPNQRFVAKLSFPVIQMQPHAFIISNGKCLSMVHGKDSIAWGLQFAYPQIVMDEAGQVEKPLRTSENGKLFLQMQKWMRDKTRPASFVIDGQKINTSLRLGKQWSGRLPL